MCRLGSDWSTPRASAIGVGRVLRITRRVSFFARRGKHGVWELGSEPLSPATPSLGGDGKGNGRPRRSGRRMRGARAAEDLSAGAGVAKGGAGSGREGGKASGSGSASRGPKTTGPNKASTRAAAGPRSSARNHCWRASRRGPGGVAANHPGPDRAGPRPVAPGCRSPRRLVDNARDVLLFS